MSKGFQGCMGYSLWPTFGQLQLSESKTKHSGTNNFLLTSKQWANATKAETQSSPERCQPLRGILSSLIHPSNKSISAPEPNDILLKTRFLLGLWEAARFLFSLRWGLVVWSSSSRSFSLFSHAKAFTYLPDLTIPSKQTIALIIGISIVQPIKGHSRTLED